MKVLTHRKERIIGFPVLPTVQEGVEKSDLDSIIEKKKASRIDTNGDFLFNQQIRIRQYKIQH
jgi:hypothetical protein